MTGAESGALPRPRWMYQVADAVAAGEQLWPAWLAPPPSGGKQSAVLMLFGPRPVPGSASPSGSSSGSSSGGEDVVLTERAAQMRAHAGQVSFPGGAMDPADGGSATVCALREASEEVGVAPAGVEVVCELPAVYLDRSGYVVTPVLAWWAVPAELLVVDPVEVARVVRAPVAELVDPRRRFTVRHPSGFVGPGFDVAGLFVWGFTALLLDGLLALAGLAGEWDPRQHRPLPDRFLPQAREARR